MRVIAQPAPNSGRRLALELLIRAVAVGLAAFLILGLLPAIANAVA